MPAEFSNFAITESIERPDEKRPGAWSELANSFIDESKVQLKGLAQVVGAGSLIDAAPQQEQPDSILGSHASMIGRAAADAIPIVLTGLAVRTGLGRLLLRDAEPAINTAQSGFLLQRSVLGLNSVETATTGFVTGALLRPTDEQNSSSVASFISDRTMNGAISALSFLTVNTLSYGTDRFLAKSKSLLASDLRNPVGIGGISGLIGGAINPQIDSLVRKHELNTDLTQMGTSVYEGAFIGIAFGAFGMARNLKEAKMTPGKLSDLTPGNLVLKETLHPRFDGALESGQKQIANFQPTHFTIDTPQYAIGFSPSDAAPPAMKAQQAQDEPLSAATYKLNTEQPIAAGAGALSPETSPITNNSVTNSTQTTGEILKTNPSDNAYVPQEFSKPIDFKHLQLLKETLDQAVIKNGLPKFVSLGGTGIGKTSFFKEVENSFMKKST